MASSDDLHNEVKRITTAVQRYFSRSDATKAKIADASAYRPSRTNYRKVMALLVHWKTSDVSHHHDGLQLVEDTFKSYNYEVFRHEIPDDSPKKGLLEKLLQLERDRENDTLIIIYYKGHGGFYGTESNGLRFTGTSPSNRRRRIQWQDIYPTILAMRCDVLTILDCCHSGASVLPKGLVESIRRLNFSFSKEVIAAAGFDAVSWGGLAYSVPAILKDVFELHKTAAKLDSTGCFNTMSHMMMSHMPPELRRESGSQPHPTNPVHYHLIPGAKTIVLQPLPPRAEEPTVRGIKRRRSHEDDEESVEQGKTGGSRKRLRKMGLGNDS